MTIQIKGIPFEIRMDHHLSGCFFLRFQDGTRLSKSFLEIIDTARFRFLEGMDDSSLNIPISLPHGVVSVYARLEIRKTRKEFFPNKRKIAVVGMKHTGSTMVWNAIRTAYSLLGYDVLVNKSHEIRKMYIDDDYLLNSPYRDVRDSAISSFLRFRFLQSLNEKKDLDQEIQRYGLFTFFQSMHENLALFYDTLSYDPILFCYEKYKTAPVQTLQALFRELKIYDDESFVHRVVDIIEKQPSGENLPKDLYEYQIQDSPVSLLTQDHNTSGGRTQKYEDFFSAEQNEIILQDEAIREFLLDFGYLETYPSRFSRISGSPS